MSLVFDNSYARLPERFFSRLSPEPVGAPALVRANDQLADLLGLETSWLSSPEGVAALAGNTLIAGALPIATVYAGHQFGSWNPQLGDGRAILLGEVVAADGERYDLQLKGSGRTPYSRGGDGRSPLGPVLREYIISEAMFALGVPTTRSLAAVTTGEQVYRQTPLPGGVLARVASSHIRVGTFEFFAARDDRAALALLVEHVIARHYPELEGAERPALALLQQVVTRQAELVAKWIQLGFIHGVMNTDNMLVSGETIDYGPCAFMDAFDVNQVYSSIDHGGRYAYGNQPRIAAWNLARFAEALLPAVGLDDNVAVERVAELVGQFSPRFQDAYRDGLRTKLGLGDDHVEDEGLINDLFLTLQHAAADLTLTFRRLTELAGPDGERSYDAQLANVYALPDELSPWIERWLHRLSVDSLAPDERYASMSRANPVFIPRNHLVQEAIEAAEQRSDFQPFHRLVELLANPFDYRPELARFARPPRPEQIVSQTFCGT